MIWKVALPPGHSSPAVHGERIYLTAVRSEPAPAEPSGKGKARLLTLALDAATGETIWEKEAPYEQLEPIHSIGSYAQPSPATDGERVVVLFGSSGLICYDRTGKLLWHRPMGPFNDDFGTGSSPIIEGDRVITNQDHDTDSFLLAVDKRTGDTIWKVERSEFPRSYSTPVIWRAGGERQIVVCGTLRAVGYHFETGAEVWTIRGLARIPNMTPVVGDGGILYVTSWSQGADAEDRIIAPAFDELASEMDKDSSGALEEKEVPREGDLGRRFRQIDRDKDGKITRAEYDDMKRIFDLSRNAVMAIRPGGKGDITASHVVWSYDRMLPYIPSPLVYRGHIFMVKNAGIVSCLEAATGKPAKQGRVSGRGNYYSSPVAGDGKVYLLSERGELSVITAEPQWREIHSARFEEDAYATPALAGGRIYLRTSGHLYCFGVKSEGGH